MSTILPECPSCGRQEFDLEEQCECGFTDQSIIAELEKKYSHKTESKLNNNMGKLTPNKKTKKQIIKEIDSWAFTFSPEENCIHLSTPALKTFKLKIILEDLEELLEFVYRISDSKKTIRELQLSDEALHDLIKEINRLIEEKRSKISIEFDKGELQGISELINKKLKQ